MRAVRAAVFLECEGDVEPEDRWVETGICSIFCAFFENLWFFYLSFYHCVLAVLLKKVGRFPDKNKHLKSKI